MLNLKRIRLKRPGFDIQDMLISNGVYIFAFFVPALILLTAYFIFGIYPVADESVLVLDLNGQYVYYFENLRDAFWGNGSFTISWSRNFSGEIIGMFAYYLASPFTIIVMLLPRSIMTTSLLIMQLMKVGTASVTFCFYLRTSKGTRPVSAFIFAMLYSLMAYMIVQLMNPMWLDGLIYLPLICLGIERITEKGEMLLFVVTLTLMFIANFYIGWMIAIFCCLYFIAYYFFISEKTVRFRFKHMLISGAKFASGGILAAVCAAWLLIPLYFSLKLGKFDFSEPSYKPKTQFEFIDFFVNLLPNVYDTCRPEGSPVVFCGVLTLMLVPLYFFNTRIKLREKIGFGALLTVLIASMYVSTADLVWHGFQVPNWLPYRYSFLISFLLIIMAAETFESIKGVGFKSIGLMFFLLSGYTLYADKLDSALAKDDQRLHILAAVWFTVLMAGIYALLLYLYKKHRFRPVPAAVAVFAGIEMLVTTTYNIYLIDGDVNYSKFSSYNRYITLGRNTVRKIYEMDDEPVYRIEKDFHRTVNDAMAFGSYGISHSSSTLNAKPIQFLRNLGFSYGGHYIKYKGATYVTDALFGVKYVMEKGQTTEAVAESEVKKELAAKKELEDKKKKDKTSKEEKKKKEKEKTLKELVDEKLLEDGYKLPERAESKHYDDLVLVNGDSKEIIYVYENPYALPIAFMADNAIEDVSFSSWENPFRNQNELLSALLSDEKREFFKKIEIDSVVPENAKPTNYGSHKKYVPREEGKNCHVEFLITAPTEDMIYMYFPSQYEREVNLWLNKDFLDYYYEGGKMCILPLGRFSEGEEISLIATVTEKKNEALFKENYFYYLDEEAFRNAVDELKKHPLEIEYFKEDHIKGTVNAEKDGILFTTISWEPGWTVYVDGKKTEPVELMNALIGIPVSEGSHTIEMKFFPKGLAGGMTLSFFGIIAVVLLGIYEKIKPKSETEDALAQ